MSSGKKLPVIVSADEIKKTIPGYRPLESDKFHAQSAKIADKEFQKAIKESPYVEVILLSGGSASGKTEYMSGYLMNRSAIILDGTLPTLHGFEVKLKRITKSKKKVVIHAVIPDDLTRAFSAFLNRDRKYSDEHFYRTHSHSRATLLEIANKYPKVPIQIVRSSFDQVSGMSFAHIGFGTHEQLIEYLESIQYTEKEIIEELS